MELEGKKIIVTGGGSGIAAGCVKGYVLAGAQVVFCDVNDEGGKTTETEANAQENATGKATYLHCNITDKAAVKEFFAKAEEIMGGLDVLANIAGVERNKAAEDFEEEDIAFVMGVNLNGTVWTNQEAYKIFVKNGVQGAIINYSSDTGLVGMENGGIYAASKGAVAAWTRSIALEWARKSSIRCNCVCPAIKTPMYKYWLETADPAVVEPYKATLKQTFPLFGDMGEVDTDLVPVMVFLASDSSRYINGQTICVNGGLVMVR